VGLPLFLNLGAGRGKDLCIGKVLPRTDHELAAAARDYPRRSGDTFPPRCRRGPYLHQWGQPDARWGRLPVTSAAATMTL
jgi:hypothetical protein